MNKPLRFILTRSTLLRASFGLVAALTVFTAPTRFAAAQSGVTASAVFVPAQISKLGFVTSGLVKEVLVKEGDAVKAGDVLVVLDAPELEFAVTAAQAALRSAEVNAELQRYGRVEERRNGKVFWTQLPKEIIEIADIKILQEQAALEAAQANLAQTVLVAPFDGTAASINMLPGEFAQPGQVVLTLAALNNLQLETTDLSERDITKIHVGDSVNIFVEALNENFEGEVSAVATKADVVGGDVVFKLTIRLNEQIKSLRWGMTAEVNIVQ